VILGVVANARAMLVARVDLAITVVVDAIAALIELSSALRDVAEVAAASLLGIAGLTAAAFRVVGHVTAAPWLDADVVRARNAVACAHRRRSRLTPGRRIADLVAVAGQTVRALRVVRRVDAAEAEQAHVVRAADAVRAARWRAGLAVG